MLNLIKANFYKVVRMKSFYVCAVLAIINAALQIMYLNSQFASFGDISPAVFGYNGLRIGTQCLSSGMLFCTIFISMLIPQEFSLGTIKNIISSGKDRISIYFSQWIVSLVVSVLYTVIPALVGFILGNSLWGYGEVSRSDYLDTLRITGLMILAVFAMQSIFIMIGFLVRRSGATIAVSWVSMVGIGGFIIPIMDYLIEKFCNVQNFTFSKYWVQTYLQEFLSSHITMESLSLGIIVCVSTIVISSAVAIVSFVQRDIK